MPVACSVSDTCRRPAPGGESRKGPPGSWGLSGFSDFPIPKRGGKSRTGPSGPECVSCILEESEREGEMHIACPLAGVDAERRTFECAPALVSR